MHSYHTTGMTQRQSTCTTDIVFTAVCGGRLHDVTFDGTALKLELFKETAFPRGNRLLHACLHGYHALGL